MYGEGIEPWLGDPHYSKWLYTRGFAALWTMEVSGDDRGGYVRLTNDL